MNIRGLGVCRYLSLVAVGFWLLQGPDAVAASCNFNSACEPGLGEEYLTCTDCGCGDGFCHAGETCQVCPDDCYSDCNCGDLICNYPAEGSGEGSALECAYSPLGNNCSYCGVDCPPACNYQYCDWSGSNGPSCDSDTGECGACQDVGWCPDSIQYDCISGVCVLIAMCPIDNAPTK